MSDVILHGFHRSTYVTVAKLVLAHKGVDFTFDDLERDMGKARHLELHPFNRVPILQHAGFKVYETSAIATYVDEAFDGPPLRPAEPRGRARMNQWISALNSYYYPWLIYHIVHERIVFPPLDIAPDEKIVATAIPHAQHALGLLEEELSRGDYLVGGAPTLADFFMLPSIVAFSMTREGERMLAGKQCITAWLTRMGALDSVKRVRAAFPPVEPIWHAREWATSHRPSYA